MSLASLGAGRAPGPAASSFVPSDIASLKLWLKEDGLSGADATPIATWTDSSANLKDYTQATEAAKPLKKTAILNGRAVARFDGTDDFLGGPASSNFLTAAAHTVFVVAKTAVFTAAAGDPPASAADTAGFFLDVDTYHATGSDAGPAGTNPKVFTGLYDGAHKVVGVVSDTAWHIWQARHDGGNLYLSKDGGAESSVAAGNVGVLTGLTRVGRSSATTYLNGDIAELIVYNAALSAGDRSSVMSYLQTRFGL